MVEHNEAYRTIDDAQVVEKLKLPRQAFLPWIWCRVKMTKSPAPLVMTSSVSVKTMWFSQFIRHVLELA